MDPITWKQLGEWRLEEMRRDARSRASRPNQERHPKEQAPSPRGGVRRAIIARWSARGSRTA
jgi:hypothetical protein